MQLPVEISYRGVDKSDEIEALVQGKADRLNKFCDHITRCDVIIERPNHSQQSGSPFHVRIDLTVPPGHELVQNEKPTKHDMHEPLTKVINDAFRHMERQLTDLVDRQQQRVKTHAEQPTALVSKLFPADGYGFITDLQGRDVYFHRDSVVNGDFDRLKVGVEVRTRKPRATGVPMRRRCTSSARAARGYKLGAGSTLFFVRRSDTRHGAIH